MAAPGDARAGCALPGDAEKPKTMKQSIQLRLGQSLVMTPQLQQAIRLLQLSTAELNAEVQEAL
ncbi:MAG: hypothetical protein ACREXJ_15135, partial [Gammaproteobacteria bacterium]